MQFTCLWNYLGLQIMSTNFFESSWSSMSSLLSTSKWALFIILPNIAIMEFRLIKKFTIAACSHWIDRGSITRVSNPDTFFDASFQIRDIASSHRKLRYANLKLFTCIFSKKCPSKVICSHHNGSSRWVCIYFYWFAFLDIFEQGIIIKLLVRWCCAETVWASDRYVFRNRLHCSSSLKLLFDESSCTWHAEIIFTLTALQNFIEVSKADRAQVLIQFPEFSLFGSLFNMLKSNFKQLILNYLN